MESELFGHTRGSFTGAMKDKPGKFQRADGGTLFLDEVGDLAAELQSKLLRAIETGEVDVVGGSKPIQVDVRVIAATNADLAARVREGAFRSDLFYRLNVIPIHVPPLRERPDDIPALWEHFLAKYTAGSAVRSTPGLIRSLMKRPWPGNVRELANVCQRMTLLRGSDVLREADLPPEAPDPRAPIDPITVVGTEPPPRLEPPPAAAPASRAPVPSSPSAASGSDPRAFPAELPADRLPLLDLERELITRALAKHGGNRTRTAEYLGIPRHVLLYRMEKFGIA
jgi:two-component system NtrC family response regulator